MAPDGDVEPANWEEMMRELRELRQLATSQAARIAVLEEGARSRALAARLRGYALRLNRTCRKEYLRYRRLY
jgi:hypothetical protein